MRTFADKARVFSRLADGTLAVLISNVTKAMFGMSFSLSPRMLDAQAPQKHLALLPLKGQVSVMVGISSSEAGCVELSSALFQCSPDKLDEAMIKDSLGELLNMAAGQVRSALALDQALGLPELRSDAESVAASEKWRIVALQAGKVDLLLWLSDQPTLQESSKGK